MEPAFLGGLLLFNGFTLLSNLNAMKNNFKIATFFMLFIVLNVVKANPNATDSLPSLEIKGKISKKGKPNGTYKVELLYMNSVVETKEVNDEDSFSFIMPGNRDYIVKIYKKGYSTKVIGINTGLHKYDYTEKYYKYEFITEMQEVLYRTIQLDSVENPVTITGLDNKEKDFNYRRKYAKKLRALPQ